MWEKYKSAIITGGVLACVMFFAIGYTVGHDNRGGMMSAGMQPPNIRSEQGCGKDFGGPRGGKGFPGNRQDQPGSAEDGQQDSQGSTDGRQAPPDVNNGQTPPQGDQGTGSGNTQKDQGAGSGSTQKDQDAGSGTTKDNQGTGSGTTQDNQGTTQSPSAGDSVF